MREQHAVVIAGGGPTGLMLAAELALAEVDVVVVERRPTQALDGPRSRGLHSRTLEVLDQRGVVDRFIQQGKAMQIAGFAMTPLDMSDFPTRHPYGLALLQEPFERLLAAWVEDELKVPIRRGHDVKGFAEDEEGVDVDVEGGVGLRAQFLVGCDGGRSPIRKQAGIAFDGFDASVSYIMAEAEMTAPTLGMRPGPRGTNAIGPADGGRFGVVLVEDEVRTGDKPTLDELRAALVAVYGSDFAVRNPVWLSRFSDTTRQAATYRKGRVLVAGDAAHVHSPVGGQGLNLGVQDAVNLGWKLAQVVKGTSPVTLLDTYTAERHPVAAKALSTTMAQTALARGDDRTKAARELVGELLKTTETRKRTAALLSGLDIHLDFGAGHPLLGRRMPDLDVVTADGPRRVFSFLHRARPVLLRFGGSVLDVGGRVPVVDATYAGTWELPVLGVVPAPSAVLVRPDGYVAWVGDGSDAGLVDAVTKWFAGS